MLQVVRGKLQRRTWQKGCSFVSTFTTQRLAYAPHTRQPLLVRSLDKSVGSEACCRRQSLLLTLGQHRSTYSSTGATGAASSVQSDTLEGWYDSHGSDKDMDDGRLKNAVATNRRAKFRDIPVNKTILSYIETIGVGMRPGARRRNKKKRRTPRRKSWMVDDDINLLSDADEKDFLLRRNARLARSGRERGSKSKKSAGQRPLSWWLPPPPFASNMASATDDEKNELGHRVIRLPVKVLGTAGSLDDHMPRSSKGLPEVALAGRSNVGKSTLLNALLYGNQPARDGSPIEWRFNRGRTPEGAKLPKGIKAVVSSRPGETRAITLYQLSSQVVFDDSGVDKAKMSLVLADLPGYGFAYSSEEKASAWRDLMQHYLLERGSSLKRVLMLIDARHGLKVADFDFLTTLQDALQQNEDAKGGTGSKCRRNLPPIQIVLTKCDLVMQDDLARRVIQVREQLSNSLRREPSSLPVMLVSAKAGLGYNNIRGERARGGVLELQKELAALVSYPTKEKPTK